MGRAARLVSDHLSDEEAGFPLHEAHAYLCGPPGMIDAALAQLAAAGVPTGYIHYDKFLDSRQLEASASTELSHTATR